MQHSGYACLDEPQPAKGLCQTREPCHHSYEGCIADENLQPLPLAENWGVGVKVVGRSVIPPTGHIGYQIQRPADCQHANNAGQSDQAGLLELVVLQCLRIGLGHKDLNADAGILVNKKEE